MNIDILIDCLLVYKNVDGNAKRLDARKYYLPKGAITFMCKRCKKLL